MTPSSDDVHRMMDENSARFHPKRGKKSRGLRQHERQTAASQQDSSVLIGWDRPTSLLFIHFHTKQKSP
ncbi:unnamed protein product [Protopolystoma xenopodis]|uniref:Uncharacterized protein n=1 Tax=Protopolystoma xenopodis TaxID=117903 RepID=A0A3S5BWQ1_9PLAT|nr:unnamed protein product [Protopolystoma xenopodis]